MQTADWISLALGVLGVVVSAAVIPLTSDAFLVGNNVCFAQECDEPGVHYRNKPCLGVTLHTHAYDDTRAICFGAPLGDFRCTGFPSASATYETPMPCPTP